MRYNHRLPRYLEPWHVCGFQIEFLVMPEIFAFVCAVLFVSLSVFCSLLFCLSRLKLFRESRSKDEIEASNEKKNQTHSQFNRTRMPESQLKPNEIILYFMFLQNIFENINKRHEL